ncbi:MAG TPA: DNA-binding response regulator [Deltaproteobacteria bacterium]|nr:DNA-binding response regulator [Deltaproteobacteria bacterium]
MKRVRVIIADDHKIMLEGLHGLLAPHFEVVATVPDGVALLEEIERLEPDVAIIDVSMPRLNGIEAVKRIKKSHPHLKCVMLTMHPDVTYASRAFEAGASGYVLKQAATSELMRAIEEALEGRTYVTPLIAGGLLESYRNPDHAQDVITTKLTDRQRQILQLFAEGFSAKEIGRELAISQRTVEFHKYRMMEALNLKTHADLVRFAVKHGLVTV